jgi:hypothetical protein
MDAFAESTMAISELDCMLDPSQPLHAQPRAVKAIGDVHVIDSELPVTPISSRSSAAATSPSSAIVSPWPQTDVSFPLRFLTDVFPGDSMGETTVADFQTGLWLESSIVIPHFDLNAIGLA